jgi:hypothetical protein
MYKLLNNALSPKHQIGMKHALQAYARVIEGDRDPKV